MSKFLKNKTLVMPDGTAMDGNPAEFLEGKFVAYYYSASWCGPCQRFTPQLAAKYAELKAAGHSFEVVLISSDRSRESAQAYHRKMPWPMLEFGQTPGCILEVPGYPTLVVFDPNGKPIGDFEGNTVVMSVPFDQWPNYEQIKKEKEKALATEWDALPAELSHPKHAHPLKKTAKMYGGTSGWNCDVCRGSGGSCRGYQCSRCGWDAHPACVGATPVAAPPATAAPGAAAEASKQPEGAASVTTDA